MPQPTTSNAVGRPRGSTAGATRARVLAAARQEFTVRGYEGASLRRIAQSSSVTLPTIYHHFGSKAGLFTAGYRAADEKLLDALEQAVHGVVPFGDRLAALVDAARTLHEADPSLSGILAVGQIERARSPELAELAGPTGAAVPALLREVVAEGARRGELASGVDVGAAVEVLTATTLGVAVYASMLGPREADGLFAAWRSLVTGQFLR